MNQIPAVSGGVWSTGTSYNSNSLHNGKGVLTSRTSDNFANNFTYTSATSYMANSIGQN